MRYGNWSHTFEDDKPGEVFNWCAFFDDTERLETVLGTGSRVVLSLRLYNSTARDDFECAEAPLETPSAAYMASQVIDLIQPLVDWSKRAISEGEEAPHVCLSAKQSDDNLIGNSGNSSSGENDSEELTNEKKKMDASSAERLYSPSIHPKLDSKLQKAFGEEYEKHKESQANLRRQMEEERKKQVEDEEEEAGEPSSRKVSLDLGPNSLLKESDEPWLDDGRVILPSPLLWTLKYKPSEDDFANNHSKVQLSLGGDTFSDVALQLCDEDWGVISSLRMATETVPNVSINLVSLQIRKHYFAVPGEHDPTAPAGGHNSGPAMAFHKDFNGPSRRLSGIQDGENWETLSWRTDSKNPTEIKARVIEAMHPGIVLPTNETSMTFEPLQSESEMLNMVQPELDICHPFVEEYYTSSHHHSESSTESDSPTVSRFVDGGEFSPDRLSRERPRSAKRETRTIYRRTLLFTRLALFIFHYNPDHPKNREALEKKADSSERGIGSGEIPDLISSDNAANHFVISERPYFASSGYKDDRGISRTFRSRLDHLPPEKQEARDRSLKRSTSLEYDRMKVHFARIDVSNDCIARETPPPPLMTPLQSKKALEEEAAMNDPNAPHNRVPSVVVTDESLLHEDVSSVLESSSSASPSSPTSLSKKARKKKEKEMKKEKEAKKKAKDIRKEKEKKIKK